MVQRHLIGIILLVVTAVPTLIRRVGIVLMIFILLSILEHHKAAGRIIPLGLGIGNRVLRVCCRHLPGIRSVQCRWISRIRILLRQAPGGFVQHPVGRIIFKVLGVIGCPDVTNIVVCLRAVGVPSIGQHILGPDVVTDAAAILCSQHNGRSNPDQLLLSADFVINDFIAAHIGVFIRCRIINAFYRHASPILHVQAKVLVAGILRISPPTSVHIFCGIRSLRKPCQHLGRNRFRILEKFAGFIGKAQGFLCIDLRCQFIRIQPDDVALICN